MYRRRAFVALLGGSVTAAVSGCQALPGLGGPDLALQAPGESTVGRPLRVTVSGIPAGGELTVELAATDALGHEHAASFPAVADDEGRAVVTGTPDDADAGGGDRDVAGTFRAIRTANGAPAAITAGLGGPGPPRMPLAATRPTGDDGPGQFVARGQGATVDRVEVTVSAGVDEVSMDATTTRILVGDAVSEWPVDRDDLVGRIYQPEADGPRPGVLVLHGSFGRVPRRFARMLASNGFAVLALQYFGAPGQPATLDDVPVEYFDRAVSYLLGEEGVAEDRVGLVGLSRGVEPALLAAASFDGPATVVGYSGSGLALPGIDTSGGVASYESAWTRDGEPIVPAEPIERILPAIPSGATTPGALEAALEELAYDEETARVGIPVEDVDGPVLLLSGQRDAVWNAPVLSEYAAARLARNDHPHPYAHVTYGGTGHVFHEPYFDARSVTGAEFGGAPRATATAAADAFVRGLDYLERGLGSG